MSLERLQASRFLKHVVLLTPDTLTELINHLHCEVCNISKVVEKRDFKEEFLKAYAQYYAMLLKQEVDVFSLRSLLTCALSLDFNAFNENILSVSRRIISVKSPVVYVRLMTYQCLANNRVIPFALGKDVHTFGLVFSFPQLYRDPTSKENRNALKESRNAALWKSITQWIRRETQILKINTGSEMMNITFRYHPLCRDILPCQELFLLQSEMRS